MGKNGRDGDGVEYVFVRTTSNSAPSISNSSDTYGGKTYLDDDYLPLSSAGRCSDDPLGTSRDYPYEWVAKRTKGSPNAETGVRQWEKYSGTMALWSNFSENTMRLDLDNEMDMVMTDSALKISAARTVQTIVRFYDGAKEISLGNNALSVSGGPSSSIAAYSNTASGNARVLSWAFKTGQTMASAYNIAISFTYLNITYTAQFTVSASAGQPVYQLRPSLSVINFARKADNTLTPSLRRLELDVVKIDGSSSEVVTSFSGISVRYSESSMPASSSSGSPWNYSASGGGKNYLKNCWQKIDGNWYYFKADGYAAANEFVQGWWLNKNGVQSDPARYGWHKTSKGWWYGVAGGWYAKGKTYTIDGVSYTFNKNGYSKDK